MRTQEKVDASNLFQSSQGVPLSSNVGSASAFFPTATGVLLSEVSFQEKWLPIAGKALSLWDSSLVQHHYQLRAFHSRQAVSPLGLRETELAWMKRNSDLLKTMVGEWVVVEKDELIGHNRSHKLVLEKARDRGISRPFMVFISREDVL